MDGGKKIRVYWSVNDSWAESYSVYRVVDGVAEENSVAVVDNVGDSVNSYDDENIVAGKSYSYFVKADNSTLTTAYFNPESEASEQSAAITPVVPTITFVQPTIKNFNLTISNSTGSASDILVRLVSDCSKSYFFIIEMTNGRVMSLLPSIYSSTETLDSDDITDVFPSSCFSALKYTQSLMSE